MRLSSQIAWVLCDSVVQGVPLNGIDSSIIARLPVVGTGTLALFRDGIVTGFPTIASLFFVNTQANVLSIPVRYTGITCLATVSDSILCGISQSGTIRLINSDGRDERSFIGHCGPVLGLERMSDVLFASRAEDETVRIWDIRQRNPISSILLPHVSVCSITGSGEHLVCGFHNKRLGVVELRKDHGKAILGVQTQDYMAVELSYDGHMDSLAMFGVIENEGRENSMELSDNDRKKVFRKYPNFVGIDMKEKTESSFFLKSTFKG
jgi:WD40 repeat protein